MGVNDKSMKKHDTKGGTHPVVMAERVFKWWDYPLFILLTLLGFSAILYFMSYWFSFEDWLYDPAGFSIMTLMLLVILSNNQGRWFLLLYMRKPRPMTPRRSWKAGVATTFVPDGEPLDMLEATLRALMDLDYPHDTWVLDEGDDDQVKALCRKLGANHFSRRNLPHYQTKRGTFQSWSKHGNYNAWLHEIGFDRYDIITAFDPDHVPEPAFLSNVLGYFEDPEVGYVQVAQAYHNQKASLVARGAAEETYAYYSSIQMASYGIGHPIIVGCHNTHRVTALKEIGGFAPHDADDLLMTLLYQTRGWKGVYVPQILAKGLTPVDWNGYLRQQRRWARSVLDVKFRTYPKLSKDLPFRARVISVLHGLNYMHRSIIILIGVILMGFMLSTGIRPQVVSYSTVPKLLILYAALQVCEFYRQRFYLDSRREWGLHWRVALLNYGKWPYLILALFDVLLNRKIPYALTRKVRAVSKNYTLLIPHMVVFVLISISWAIGAFYGHAVHPTLHILAALVLTGSLALILTEHLGFSDS